MRRARLLAAEGKWGKTPPRYRLLGFKVIERTPQTLTIQLPFWLRGREELIAKAIRNTERDAELAELDIKIECGHRLLKITRGVPFSKGKRCPTCGARVRMLDPYSEPLDRGPLLKYICERGHRCNWPEDA